MNLAVLLGRSHKKHTLNQVKERKIRLLKKLKLMINYFSDGTEDVTLGCRESKVTIPKCDTCF
jgi:hypothetical protein